MTNRVALFLALAIIALLVADHFANQGEGTLFLLRKLNGLVNAMAIWR